MGDKGKAQPDRGFRRPSKETLAACTILVALVSMAAFGVSRAESRSRTALEERFQSRADAGARFISAYMAEMIEREIALAQIHLTGEVSPKKINLLTDSLESEASLLLDKDGRFLTGAPFDPALVGKQIGSKYPHLSSAMLGVPAISPVVLSAADNIPVVGAAVPFDSDGERRVFSAALSIANTPLKNYLTTLAPIEGASSYLVDVNGAQVVANVDGSVDARFKAIEKSLAVGEGQQSGSYTLDGEEMFFSAQDVKGAPWTIVATVPKTELLAPFYSGRWVSWVMLTVLTLLGVAVVYLFIRFSAGRREFRRRSLHCSLTGLANRSLFTELAEQSLARLRRRPGSLGTMYIDLDGFKTVNDTLGHEAGDELLVAVASRMKQSVRDCDVVARMGGDEFAILLVDAGEEELRLLADRVLEALSTPFSLGADQVQIGASIGIATSTGQNPSATLLQEADAAMYVAKTGGKGRYSISSIPESPAAEAPLRLVKPAV